MTKAKQLTRSLAEMKDADRKLKARMKALQAALGYPPLYDIEAAERNIKVDRDGPGGLQKFHTAEPVVRLRHPDGSHDEIPNPTGDLSFRGAFAVDPDGGLHDEDGHRIFIERRVGRVGVG